MGLLTNLSIRQIRSGSFLTSIQIISLALGYTVFLILFSIIHSDLDYDTFWGGEAKLYRVAMEHYTDGELSFKSAKGYRGMPGVLEEELPEVLEGTRLIPDLITVFVGEQQIQDVKMFYADTNVFRVLPRKILAAESSEIFPGIHSVAISESLARTLFGTTQCLGEEIRLNEGWRFNVSTVFQDIPIKSHLKCDLLLTWASLRYYMQNFDNATGVLIDDAEFSYVDPGPYHSSSWNNTLSYNYIRVVDNTKIPDLQRKASKILSETKLPERISDYLIRPVFQPVEKIHLQSSFPDEVKINGSMFRIRMLILIALLVLIVSWINFVNLHYIAYHKGVKARSVRIIHGESFKSVLKSIFQTAWVVSIIALLLSFCFIYLLSIYFQSFTLTGDLIILFIGIPGITALLSLLPPFSLRPDRQLINGLRGSFTGKFKGLLFRRVMVFIQFFSGIGLISFTIIIYSQFKYIQDKELGFNGENVVYSYSPMTMNQRPDIQDKLSVFRNEVSSVPGVESFCVSSSIPGQPIQFQGIKLVDREGKREIYTDRIHVDYSYFELYDIRFLAGRNFYVNENYDNQEIILNRKAAGKYGFQNPKEIINEFISCNGIDYKVVGVVENYHHYSLKDQVIPITFFKSLKWRANVGYYSFKIQSGYGGSQETIENIWKSIYPEEQFLFSFADDSYDRQYDSEREFGKSLMYSSILAILISCLGLIALANFNIIKKTREIGIRKTYGAGSFSILKHMQKEIMLLVLISAVFGIPVAYKLSEIWLANFTYRINPAWWMFFMAVVILMVIAFFSTFLQTWKAAKNNPVDALRYE